MYKEFGISSNNVPITLLSGIQKEVVLPLFFAGYYVTPSHV